MRTQLVSTAQRENLLTRSECRP